MTGYRLTFRGDDWLVTDHTASPVGMVLPQDGGFTAIVFLDGVASGPVVGRFPDLMSAAYQVFGVHLAVTD